MSTFLYALAQGAVRARKLVLIIWIAVLALLGTSAAVFGQGANASISIPGTESQEALDTLGRTFEEVSGTSATIIVVGADAARVDADPYRGAILDVVDDLEAADRVTAVTTPFSEPPVGLSDDGNAALLTIQIDATSDSVPDSTLEVIESASTTLTDALPAGAQVSFGGEAFSVAVPGVSPTEAVGVVIAFVVLILTLGSLIAAGMPILIALIGVGVSIAALFTVTAFIELTSTTPMLALMLGLAVGIDYTLFIVSRHQEQLRAGLEVDESIARATATSGSAVVFAGVTVIIALVGLSVAGIPFLTALGVAAAAAVAIAVLIAVTLTPAILGMAGRRILPRKQREAAPQTTPRAGFAERFFGRWVDGATKRPLITLLAGLALLIVAAIPALDLRLALPNATSLPEDDPARVTYELTGEHYGEGYNGPLILTGSIITSEDPVGLMVDVADAVRDVPGVADVPLATPNPGADTGIVQVVPDGGPHAESTAELVQTLRDHHDEWEKEFGVSLAVTGFTAVGIDVSNMLLHALIPFGAFVVGLSLILLTIVFRSIWVPIKATLGFLFSVGAAFGAVVAVFEWGWLQDLLHVPSTGPVLSFMPIILMGVLFGLAMDYELFLVSRIREEHVHGADAQTAIRRGFIGSGRVVTAAALIMFAVFAAFVPEGDPSIKVIALGLAVGVFVDAFIVRMTLVPAALALLGERAWRMPRWLDRVLPSFDVEGEGIARELAHRGWPVDMPDARIASKDLIVAGHRIPDIRLGSGEALVLDPASRATAPLTQALTGRRAPESGTLTVTGLILPERAATLRSRAADADPMTLRAALHDRPSLIVLDLRSALAAPEIAGIPAMRSALEGRAVEAERGSAPPVTIVIVGTSQLAEQILPSGTRITSVTEKQEVVR
ncbi:MMPL family transporter [Leucobacter tardus]|uniref:MMPL family transporter n=1 Tax=Leucobacter tardus TaxID=501483 RepID=A0A939QJR2_9MICO|nr:MMPL family transporter [Leucobacter tardus]MBO2988989.1 MMPL family transporter [Leucobacter tardus]